MLSPLACNYSDTLDAIYLGKSGVRIIEEWNEYQGLRTRLGSRIEDVNLPENFDIKSTRSMGRVAILATLATEQAIASAGLTNDPVLQSGRTGIAYGSGIGSTDA